MEEPGEGESEGDDEEMKAADVDTTNFAEMMTVDEDSKVAVSEPKKVSGGIGSHIAYKLKGEDTHGEFEVVRRYKEFLTFRETLTKRYPGFFVPPIPEKVAKNMNK